MKLSHRIQCLSTLALAVACASNARGQGFTSLQPGFTQDVFAIATLTRGAITGIAFAPNGDVWATPCTYDGVFRFLAGQTETDPISGLTIHKQAHGSPISTYGGCGLINRYDGFIYTAASPVSKLDATTGALVDTYPGTVATHGPAVDPQTGDIVYIGDGNGCYMGPQCDIWATNPVTRTTRRFATLQKTWFVNGLVFDPSGDYLFVSSMDGHANPDGLGEVEAPIVVLDRSGSVVNKISIPVDGGAYGLAFHATHPMFIVTSNRGGTLSKIDFANKDFTQPASVTQFASVGGPSGSEGGGAVVGPDSCLWVIKGPPPSRSDGRYGIVRICEPNGAGFAQPTLDRLIQLTKRFVANHGVATVLVWMLNAATATGARGNEAAKGYIIGAYIHAVQAQVSHSITPEHAALLIQLARSL
jgi:hypothetical protein